MGQKVNPHGLRVGVNKEWSSSWIASKKEFSNYLIEDNKITVMLVTKLKFILEAKKINKTLEVLFNNLFKRGYICS